MNDNSKVKKIVNYLMVIYAVFFLLLVFLPKVINPIGEDKEITTAKADGFTIESYLVILEVSENNIVEVTEKITIDFFKSGKHGIYKFTPEWLEYTPYTKQKTKRKSVLSDYRAVNEEFQVDFVKRKPRLRIGSPSITLPVGPHDYEIKYTYDMGSDPFKGFDAFIFHAFGDYWGTRINNPSLEIHLPKDFNIDNVSFWGDKYRQKNLNSYVEYYKEGNVLYVKLNDDFSLDRSLTVDIVLPAGYFTKGSYNYGFVSLSACLSVILVGIYSYISWRKYGKDHPKVSQTIEFTAPEDYDCAEIGYISKSQSGNKLTIGLIVQLAAKGLIKINESEDKKKRTIINLLPKESDISKKDKIEEKNSEEFEVPVLTEQERATRELKFKRLTKTESLVYKQLFKNGDIVDLSEDKNFYEVYRKVDSQLKTSLKNKIHDKKATNHQYILITLFMLSIVLVPFAWFVAEDLDPKIDFLYLVALITLPLILFFIFIMRRKTIYGEEISARVEGFKDYINLAEKERIETLVEENPNHFYDILPYAYVLGLTNKWISRFKDIPVENLEMGNFDYTSIDSFDTLAYSVYSPPSSSSSSCGGGCSSCGGGCSSCGGGGSW